MFKLNGTEYSLEEVTSAAEASNLSVDEYVNEFGLETIEVTDEIQTTPTEGKTSDVATVDAAVTSGPDTASENTELEPVNIFSESPDPKLRFIDFKINGKESVLYENDYIKLAGQPIPSEYGESYAGKNYPETFEEYAKLFKTPIQTIDEGVDLESGIKIEQLEEVVVTSEATAKTKKARQIASGVLDTQAKITEENNGDLIVSGVFQPAQDIYNDFLKSVQTVKSYEQGGEEQQQKEIDRLASERDASLIEAIGEEYTNVFKNNNFSTTDISTDDLHAKDIENQITKLRTQAAENYTRQQIKGTDIDPTRVQIEIGYQQQSFTEDIFGQTEVQNVINENKRVLQEYEEDLGFLANRRPLEYDVPVTFNGKTYLVKTPPNLGDIEAEAFAKTSKILEQQSQDILKRQKAQDKKAQPYLDQIKEYDKRLSMFLDPENIPTQASADLYNNLIDKRNQAVISLNAAVPIEEQTKLVNDANAYSSELKQLEENAKNIGSTYIAGSALSKNYSKFDKLMATIDSQLLAPTVKVGAELAAAAIYPIDSEMSLNLSQASTDYFERISDFRQTEFPQDVTKVNGDLNADWTMKLTDMSINNASTIAAVLLPQAGITLGVGSKLFMKGASRFARQKLMNQQRKKALNISSALFFNMSAGSQLATQQIAVKEAPEQLNKLKGALDNVQSNPDEYSYLDKKQILEQIDYYENVLDTEGYKRYTNAALYGALEVGIERSLGTLRVFKNARQMSNTLKGKKLTNFQKQYRQSLTNLINIPGEIGEEFLVEGGNNILDNLFLGENKSIFDGMNLELAENSAFSIVAMRGPSNFKNVYNGIKNQLTSSQDKKKTKAKIEELFSLEGEIQNNRDNPGALKPAEIRAKRNRIYEIQNELRVDDFLSIQKWTGMTDTQKRQLIDLGGELAKAEAELFELAENPDYGVEGFNEAYKAAEQKVLQIQKQQGELLKTKKYKAFEYTKDELKLFPPAIVEARSKVLQTSRDLASIQNDGKVVSLTDPESVEAFIEDNNFSEEEAEGFRNSNAAVFGGQIVLNETIIRNQVLFGSSDTALTSAISPLHELFHLEAKKQKIFTGKNLSEKLKIAVLGLEDIVDQKVELGSITEATANSIKNRIKQYKDDPSLTEDIRLEEVMAVFTESVLLGKIKKSDMPNMYGTKSFLNTAFSTLTGGKFKSVIDPFTTSNDLYEFISNFATKAAQVELQVGDVEEDDSTIKASLKADDSNKVNKIFAEKGTDGSFEILELLRPTAVGLANRFNKRPSSEGSDKQLIEDPQAKQLLVDEIMTGKRGMIDVINEYATKVKEGEKVGPLSGFLNNSFSTKTGFKRYIEAADRVVGKEFGQSVDNLIGLEDTSKALGATTTKDTSFKLVDAIKINKEPISTDTKDKIIKLVTKETEGIDPNSDTFRKKALKPGNELINFIKQEILGGRSMQDYRNFIRENPNFIKGLNIAQLTRFDTGLTKQGKPRLFTELNRRLTKQGEIEKFIMQGRIPYLTTQQIKAGANLYNRLKPTETQLVNFLTNDTAQTVSNRKTAIASAIATKFIAEATPSTEAFQSKPQAEQAKIAEKLQVEPSARFSKAADIINVSDTFNLDYNAKDKLLETFIGEKSFNLKTEEGVKEFVEAVKTKLLPLMPKEFWFGARGGDIFTPSYKVVGSSDNPKLKQKYKDLYNNIYLPSIRALRNDDSIKYGKPIEGVNDYSVSAYSNIFKNKDTINKNIKNGKVEEWNKKVSTIHREMWKRFDKAMVVDGKIDKTATKAIANYLGLVANDTGHWHKLGAQFIGYSDQITGKRIEYEHAMPATMAYLYLLDASLSKADFNTAYDLIIDNYKLIALDKAMDDKLRNARTKSGYSLQKRMPDDWSVIDGKWWQRYFNNIVALQENGIDPKSIIGLDGRNFEVIYGINAEGKPTTPALSESEAGASVSNNNKLMPVARFSKKVPNPTVLNRMGELDADAKRANKEFYDSVDLNKEFNDILEVKTGIASEKRYKRVKAEVVGANKGRFQFFIPPSAEDFTGLLYSTLAKGKLGDAQMAWYKKNLLDPYGKAMNELSSARIAMMNDYKQLKKELEIVPKDLRKKVPGEPFTREQAVRVYIWQKQGMSVPGISEADMQDLSEYVANDTELQLFAEQLINIQKGDQYAGPKEGWPAGTITTDMLEGLNTIKRAKALEQWQANADEIFSETNLNKLEAAYGKPYRLAMENMLQRMKSGRNRNFQGDTLTGRFTDWVTGSIGTIMFFNTRSALLQTISSINFVNFTDNNVLAAGKAFANQKQFWSDFMTLMNSDFLKERRGGLRINVSEADIADMAKKGGAKGVINKLLEFGFTPTQIADSFAIASGGSAFYRNRIKTYKKQGMTDAEAEAQAFVDFRETAEESQQSSRPDRISMQQAGPLGRLVLAFANTPAQYARLIKKAASDIKNRRGDAKTNISKIIYYGVAQNLLFNALQQALFAFAFGDDEEDTDEKQKKYVSIANGMMDSLLRGMGLGGAVVSVGKNSIIRIINEMEKKQPKLEKVGYEITKLSPPISAKLSRINQAARSYQWDKKEMMEKGWSLDNPAYLAGANVIAALTNIPLDRAVKKTNNVVQATSQDLETWERLALLGGWQDWEIGIEEEKPSNKPQPRKSKFKKKKF